MVVLCLNYYYLCNNGLCYVTLMLVCSTRARIIIIELLSV